MRSIGFPTLAVVVALVCVVGWGGCSIERDYAVLSFFFDGVPLPGSEDASSTGAAGAGGSVAGPNVSFHTAYTERRCAECHGDQSRFGFTTDGFTKLEEGMCLQCHADVLEQFRVHGPVAVGDCLECHQPHVSRHVALLAEASPPLCLKCHSGALHVDATRPGHEDPERNCLDCHYGHGGADQFFLRPDTEWRYDPPETPGAAEQVDE